MLGLPARLAAFGLVSAAAFLACGLQTAGIPASGAGAGASTSSSTGHATGGAGGAPVDAGNDAGGEHDAGHDAGPDAAPVEAGPTVYASCKALLGAQPGTNSGVYSLVDGSHTAYQAYCDMEDDGGGWTLVLKINGDMATFQYGEALWTNTSAYNADLPALDTNEAKLASFWSVPFTELRLGMIDPTDLVTRWLDVPIAGSSLLDLVSGDGGDAGDAGDGGDAGVTQLGVGAWEGLLASGSIQTNCNWQPINADGHVRIGLVGDESGDCQSPDSFIGFGADTWFQQPDIACGNTAHDTTDHGDRSTPTFGYVMVR
jgi:Fibrinogen beta and gamma chains, C-terminal globular domain